MSEVSEKEPAPFDLTNWMRNLPPPIRDMPLFNIAIPGSHNAMMYSVLKNSPAAPDAPKALAFVNRVFPTCVQNWLLTQQYTIRPQLEHGIRYFDIRTNRREDGRFMFCHGLYACEDLQPLEEINSFLNAHPKEVVILDFQHVYNCDREEHQKYCNLIISIFGKKILPRINTDLAQCSLESMTRKGQQVIVVYRRFCDEGRQFWCSNHFPTPWPNTMSRMRLKEVLDFNIQLRDMDNGFVTQCVLTPTVKYILMHPFGSVRKSCAKRVLDKLSEWIEGRAVGPVAKGEATPPTTHNVFIADYVDLEEDKFIKTVINLNYPKVTAFEEINEVERKTKGILLESVTEEVTDLE